MLRAFIKVFVILPLKLMAAFAKVGVALLTTFGKLITLPIRIIF